MYTIFLELRFMAKIYIIIYQPEPQPKTKTIIKTRCAQNFI